MKKDERVPLFLKRGDYIMIFNEKTKISIKGRVYCANSKEFYLSLDSKLGDPTLCSVHYIVNRLNWCLERYALDCANKLNIAESLFVDEKKAIQSIATAPK